MIELGTQPGSDAAVAKETTDQTFMADVIDASRQTPVIVDFWAPWCGPCKTLGPMLEAAVQATNGAVKMVKVDIDRNPQLAQILSQQLRAQSIPAVFAFVHGQPVDGFMGAISQSEIKQFVQRLAQDGQGGGLEAALDQADQLLEQKSLGEAAQVYAAVVAEDAENARAHAGLVKTALAAGDIEQAKAALAQVPVTLSADAHIASARSAVEVAEEAQGAAGAAEALAARLEADPSDHQARYDLAMARVAQGRTEDAVELLLELFRRDREWNEGAAKTQLMTLFESLGPKDPVAQKGRRRLSSLIFA